MVAILRGLLVLGFIVFACSANAAAAAAKPNVLVILSDDLGSIDEGCYGQGTWLPRPWIRWPRTACNSRVRLPGRYFPDLMVEKAKSFINAHKDQPLFMYFAINMPHYPYQGEPKWLEYYRNKQVPYPRYLYAGFVSTMDERIQRLIDFLADTHLRERTIIVYQSDNGHSTEVRAHGGGGNSGVYRGAKFSLFEGGIRLPAIVSWPGHLPEGEVRGQIAHGCDWLPTLAELCGVPLPNAPLDGRSLVPVIRSAAAPSPHQALQWRLGEQWAVRQGDWKLLHKPIDPSSTNKVALVDQRWFLANIEHDPSERTNLAAQHPDIVDRLRQLGPRDAR